MHHSKCSLNEANFFIWIMQIKVSLSDYTYVLCKLSFCQIVCEMFDFLGSVVRKWILGK